MAALNEHSKLHTKDLLTTRITSITRDILPLLILAIAVIGVPVLIFEPQGLPRLRALQHEVAQVEAENRALEREIRRLREEVRLLKEDLSAIEQNARIGLGLVRKSEIILQLPKEHAP